MNFSENNENLTESITPVEEEEKVENETLDESETKNERIEEENLTIKKETEAEKDNKEEISNSNSSYLIVRFSKRVFYWILFSSPFLFSFYVFGYQRRKQQLVNYVTKY